APAVDDRMGLEAVQLGVAALVALDQPAVALDVDPRVGVRAAELRAVEDVVQHLAAGRALFDVDALRRRVGDRVALDGVAVAVFRLATADGAPVRFRGTDVNALAEGVPPVAGVAHGVAAHHIVGAEVAQVDALVADLLHGQALDESALDVVGHEALLAVAEAQA